MENLKVGIDKAYHVCHDCQLIGTRHCANPEECGSIKSYPTELRKMIEDSYSSGVSLSIIAEKAFDMGNCCGRCIPGMDECILDIKRAENAIDEAINTSNK